jgi:hypothetical protein
VCRARRRQDRCADQVVPVVDGAVVSALASGEPDAVAVPVDGEAGPPAGTAPFPPGAGGVAGPGGSAGPGGTGPAVGPSGASPPLGDAGSGFETGGFRAGGFRAGGS